MFQVTSRGELTEEPTVEAKAASLEGKSNEGENIAKKNILFRGLQQGGFFLKLGWKCLLRRIQRRKKRGVF